MKLHGALWVALLPACAGRPSQMPPASSSDQFLVPVGKASGAVQLRAGVCEGFDLRPDYSALNEGSLVRFLEQQQLSVQVQHQQVDPKQPPLTFLFVGGAGSAQPVALRVAVLPNSDEAGRSLHDALLQRGSGSWGFHRSNVSVLGPIGNRPDDVAYAAKTKLACWGSLTLDDGDEVVVIPGGYAEP